MNISICSPSGDVSALVLAVVRATGKGMNDPLKLDPGDLQTYLKGLSGKQARQALVKEPIKSITLCVFAGVGVDVLIDKALLYNPHRKKRESPVS